MDAYEAVRWRAWWPSSIIRSFSMSPVRKIAYVFSMAIFVWCLLYANGVPFLVASIMKQTGHLPPLDEAPTFYALMFPLDVMGQLRKAATDNAGGDVDLFRLQYLTLALPFFIVALVIECFIIFVILPEEHRPVNRLRINDAINSLSLGMLFVLANLVFFFAWSGPIYDWCFKHLRVTDAFVDGGKNSAATWWACLVLVDFFYYCWHRTSHKISWLWATHVVHHSSEEFNLSTALRQPFISWTPDAFISAFPLAILGFPHVFFSVHVTFNLLWQYWLHTQLLPPMPWVEYVFNTPSLHRIHHGRNLLALGKNYGSIFSVWDRMGGTFEAEQDVRKDEARKGNAPAVAYGVVPALHSWDPLWANLSHWHHMLCVQPQWHGGRLAGLLQAPFRHWTPPGAKCPDLGTKMNPLEKYDRRPESALWYAYAILQFVVALAFTLLIIAGGGEATRAAQRAWGWHRRGAADVIGILLFLAVVWIVHGIGNVMENAPGGAVGGRRRRIVAHEAVRHLVFTVVGVMAAPSAGGAAARLLAAGYAAVNFSFLAVAAWHGARRGNGGGNEDGGGDLDVPLLPLASAREQKHHDTKTWVTWYRHATSTSSGFTPRGGDDGEEGAVETIHDE